MRWMWLLLLAVVLGGCTDAPNTARLLEAEGMQNVQITGYQFFGCGQEDWYHTGFRGIKNGKAVEGVVCSGILKGHTIRYF